MDPTRTATVTTASASIEPVISTGKALVPITGQELELFSQAAADPAATKQALMMRDALTPEQQNAAKKEAAQSYAAMKSNPQVIVSYGSQATAEVDDVGKQMLRQLGGERLDVVKQMLKELNDGMRRIQRGYDVKNSQEARQKYEAASGKVTRLLHLGKDFLSMMIEEFQKFDNQLDGVAKKLDSEEQQQQRNLGFYNELYKANQKAIDKLVFVIAVMEYIAELAAAEAQSIEVNENQPDWQRKREERDRIAQIAENMQVKAGDFKGIYFLSLASAPQVRITANQVLGVISKLETVKTQTIGAMRRILAQYIMLVQSQGAMALADFVAQTNEAWTQTYFENAPELIAQIAQGVEKPVIGPDTIAIMAKSLEDSSNELVAAIQEGQQARLAVNDAIRAALPQINAAGARVSDETIRQVLGSVVQAAKEQQAGLSSGQTS
jgi:uncharacterized protein YaaN involved in tellurite resistance